MHRDVTSYNVMLDDGGRVVVTDFGIARMGDSALTRTGAMMGTSSYLSPEQAQGRQADERSDLYSLGVVLYEMLTGRVPFRGETDVAVAMQHVSTAPPNPRTLEPGVSEALAGVAMRALSKNPDDRFQTADEFAAALRKARRPGRAVADDGVKAAGAIASVGAAGAAVAAGAAGAGVLAAVAGAAPAAAPARTPVPAPAPTSVGPPPVRQPAAPASVPEPTALVSDAPTRYRSGEPATIVRPRRRRRRRTIVLAVVLVALAAAAAWAAYTYGFAPGATVPKVVGLARPDATGAIRDEGLRPVLHYVWADKYAEGAVARQSPRGGASVDDGVKVDLWVSRGPLHIPSPDLTGLAASVAQSQLQRVSLNAKSRRAASDAAPKGQIFKQVPAAGATVQRGDTVTFWVSSGPPRAFVPDVVGLSQGDAKAQLEAEGFVVSSDYVAGWGSMPGNVVGQDPAAGTRGRAGDEVVIQVAVF